jgi:hypothetical protein
VGGGGHERESVGSGRQHQSYQSDSWVKEYAVEIGMGAAVLIAIFLLVEPWDLRHAVLGWLATTADTLSASIWNFGVMVMNRLTLSDGIAVIILISVVMTAVARLRWRVLHNPKYWNESCPKCQSTDLKRIHRRWYERLAGRFGFPIRRYRCGECGWSGGRIVKYHGP